MSYFLAYLVVSIVVGYFLSQTVHWLEHRKRYYEAMGIVVVSSVIAFGVALYLIGKVGH